MLFNAAMDNWTRCSIAFESLCDGIVLELEGIRHNVNIASIVGSSVGIIGSSLALAGVITAPFTFGASLGLGIAGGVIGGLGGITSAGSKVTEVVMNKKWIMQMQRRQRVLQERSHEVKLCHEKLEKSVKDLLVDADPPTLDDLRVMEAQATPGILRSLKGFSIIPLLVVRSAGRVATISAAVITPLSLILDAGIVAYSAYNLAKGSRTNVTENLRTISVLLRKMRIQMQIQMYGSQRFECKTE